MRVGRYPFRSRLLTLVACFTATWSSAAASPQTVSPPPGRLTPHVRISPPADPAGEQLYQQAVQAGKSGQLALAIDYLKKAAALNYGPAEQALGNDYLKGIGVPRDPGMAVKFFSLGVKQNGKASEYGLAKMYEDGNAVPRNEALAIKLYQQSAAQHYGVAEGALGLDYEFGRGVPHNRALAIEYLKRAAIDDNNPTAARYVDILRRAPASTHFSTEIQIATYGAPTMSRPSVQTASRKNNCPEEPVFRTINARNFCSAHPGCPYAVEQMNSYYTHAAPFEHVCGN